MYVCLQYKYVHINTHTLICIAQYMALSVLPMYKNENEYLRCGTHTHTTTVTITRAVHNTTDYC